MGSAGVTDVMARSQIRHNTKGESSFLRHTDTYYWKKNFIIGIMSIFGEDDHFYVMLFEGLWMPSWEDDV